MAAAAGDVDYWEDAAMKILKAYKTELDPNNKQRTFFARCCGASRYVYNWGLAEWKSQYESGDKPSAYALRKQFNAQKDEACPWIRALPYAVTEAAFLNLGLAFQHFFRRCKNNVNNPGYPNFKKRGRYGSFQVRNLKVESDRVRITSIGWVRLKERNYIPINAAKYGIYATVSERAGRWFISVQVEEESLNLDDDSNTIVIGVDFGLKALAVCSDGTVYENLKPLVSAEKKLKRLDRELARRTQGGSNWRKTQKKRQRQYAKIANIRAHMLHNISHDLVVNKHPAIIVIENLNVSGMMANHRLAKAIQDAGFYELRRQIEYKAKWHGVKVIVVDGFFPSSKLCSNCGSINDDLTLADRIYVCDCGNKIDRDLNAALNLAAYGVLKAETQPDCLGS